MLPRLGFCGLLLMAPATTRAEDPMDTQRLVWRCGAAAQDRGLRPDSGAYGSFVQQCIDEGEGKRGGRTPSSGAAAPHGREAVSATITGELSYPGEWLPEDLKVCAERVDTKQRTCTSRRQKRGRSMRYELKVPAGTYYVFANSSEWNGAPAYYSEFVTCGLDSSCPSHKPIPVTVGAGERRTGIDPGDWYAGN